MTPTVKIVILLAWIVPSVIGYSLLWRKHELTAGAAPSV